MNPQKWLSWILQIKSDTRSIICSFLSLCGIQVAQSDVIYSGTKDITIHWPYVYFFDANNDGSPDFVIKTDRGGNGSPPPGANSGEWFVSGFHYTSAEAQVLGEPGSRWGYSAALPYGFSIGPDAPSPLHWQHSDSPIWSAWVEESSSTLVAPEGPWWGASHLYLGFDFPTGNGIRYGWAQLSVNVATGDLILHDYAYESTGGPILAGVIPEPAIVPLVVLGLAIFRLSRKQ
jgi:hypothetical protein